MAEELLKRRLARRSLIPFCQYTFPSYEPAAHLVKLAEKLEALERGEIKRLMVFMAPRHGKSEICSIRFPAWYLGKHQQNQIIGCSYAEGLAYSFSYAVRETIANSSYQRLWPLNLDTSGAIRWQLEGKENKRSSYIAAGVGGGITGEGADLAIIDDPIKNPEEAQSETYREKTWQWYRQVLRTRLQPGGAVILILTRWHTQDLAGKLLDLANSDPEADQWEVLHLPAIKDGQALWPERYPLHALENIRASIGGREFEAQYQGSPTIAEGNIIKREWWRYYRERPICTRIIHSWDSVEADAVLTLNREGFVTLMTFEDLWGKIKTPIISAEGREMKPVDGWQIMGRRKFTDLKYISRHLFDGELADVTNRCGRVKVTNNHSLIDGQGKKISPLDLGFRTNLPAPPLRNVPRKQWLRRRLFIGSVELAWTCGLFVAEGSTSLMKRIKPEYANETATSIANKDRDLLYRAQKAIKSELHIDTAIYGLDKFGMSRLASYNKLLFEYFSRFYDSRREKIVPDDIFNGLPKIQKSFLDGYMAGDGCIHEQTKSITTKSPILAHQIVLLFNELEGLKPRFYWRGDKRHIYHIEIGQHRLDTLSNAVRQVPYRGWVYDVETESHEFRAGNILVSNTAFKDNASNDYSVGTVWGKAETGLYLFDMWRQKVEFPELKRAAVALNNRDHPHAVLIEDAASGQSLIQELRRDTLLPVLPVKVGSNKTVRVNAISPLIESGRVFLPEQAPWLHDFMEEVSAFPNGEHDDIIDSMTQALSWFAGTGEPASVDLPVLTKRLEFSNIRERTF